jgi:ATP-dependent Clp protease ATP-binding subunit ClpA
MNESFTERARNVVAKGKQVASELRSACTEPEHVFLGLFSSPESLAAHALTGFKLTDAMALSALRKLSLPTGDEQTVVADNSPTLEYIFGLAMECAQQLGDSKVGTEHLLLGIAVFALGEGLDGQKRTLFKGARDRVKRFFQLLGTEPSEVKSRLLNLLEKDPDKIYVEVRAGNVISIRKQGKVVELPPEVVQIFIDTANPTSHRIDIIAALPKLRELLSLD